MEERDGVERGSISRVDIPIYILLKVILNEPGSVYVCSGDNDNSQSNLAGIPVDFWSDVMGLRLYQHIDD